MPDTVTITPVTQTITVTPAGGTTTTITPVASQAVTITQSASIGSGLASTDDLIEGSTNLYFTNTRAANAAPVQSVIAATGVADAGVTMLTSEAGVVSVTNTKLGTVTGLTMPSGYAVADSSGALTVSYNNLAAIRTGLGLGSLATQSTIADAYTGQIETAADKTYTIDPGAVSARTITGFYIKSASGTCTANLKVGTNVVKAASVSSSSGDQTSLANTAVAVNDVITLVVSSNSSALDVIFSVEYTA